MKKLPSCVEETINLCLPLGHVSVKPMFGGHGLYFEDIMFALEAYGEIYLKTDKETESLFSNAGSEPFTYEGKSKPIKMSYWLVPSIGWEDHETFLYWAELAITVSKRAKRKKKPVKK
ncbi:TfoX/Sxy family protein [Kiloniella sp.]|uniref:TfoX/Sxy family protein n=1 Tax=Kiloniella sp. TaxID=1938587 RepID=UPI003B01A5E9